MKTEKNQNDNKHSNMENRNEKRYNNKPSLEDDDTPYASPDKYLAMEQKGVSYTKDHNPIRNSDQMEYDNDENNSDKWKAHARNSRNADAFNQDDYILNDNIDLDEDQSRSLSSEEDFDTNTLDETR